MGNELARTQESTHTGELTLGAIVGRGGTAFRVWAPDSRVVQLVLFDAEPGGSPGGIREVRDLQRRGGGYWSGRFGDITAGALYKFRLDGDEGRTFPDPASRYQPFGVHGPSMVVDPSQYRWSDAGWTPPPYEDLIIYEVHVGTCTPAGRFDSLRARLGALADLGVTAIELMPVADFPGDRNWGYDGVTLFAPSRRYGTPDDLRALVDAAHAHGLAVLLDVVYNHFGPDGAYANAFSSHYFTDAHESPWGQGVNLDRPHSEEVRRFFIENAVQWVRDYHMDGLRLDATHALIDEGPRHFLEELTTTVRATAGRRVYVIAEDHRNLATLLRPPAEGGFGLDGVWADDFHHQARVHTAGDHEGYYADFTGSTADLARTIEQGWFYTGQYSAHEDHARGTAPTGLHPRQFVVCIQNHDQVGNRADGARLHHGIDAARYRALSALLILAPQTPLLFMGQEWAATAPFQYFTDHGEELGRQVTEGRRREFGSFAAFADPEARAQIPDPQAAATFERSRLNWAERGRPEHAAMLRLYRRLIGLRRASAEIRTCTRTSFAARPLDGETLVIGYGDDTLMVVARLGGGAGEVRLDRGGLRVVLSTEDEAYAPDPHPIGATDGDGTTLIRFQRPGAVVLRHGTL